MKGPRFALILLLLLAPPLAGQEERISEAELPTAVADEIVRFLNDSTTIRMVGGGEVPPEGALGGDVAVLGGSLVLAGEVAGDLMVVNGALRFRSGARVSGDVTVAGGDVEGEEEADLGGRLSIYSERLRYVRQGGRIVRVQPGERDPEGLSSTLGFGRSRITVRAGTNYNRIEGLPVMFGPVIETESANPLHLAALGIWRSDNGFDLSTDEMGYRVLLEQYLGGRRTYSIGAVAHSLVEPLERWTLSDLESSLASFLLHRDYRDYLERTGWSAFATVRPERLPLDVRFGYREEEHAFAAVGSPWALKANDQPWRPQPLVAEGRLRSIRGTATVDTRNDREEPTHGWWIRVRAERPLGGALRIPAHLDPFPGEAGETPAVAVPPRPVDTDFTFGFADVRRYNRVSPGAELVLRSVFAGSLTGGSLPPQFQQALGGEGSIPGFRLFSVDCGARLDVLGVEAAPEEPERAFPAYGCDRMALFQAEFRRDLGGGPDRRGDEGRGWQEGWERGLRVRPRIAAFLNAGRGWALQDESADPRSVRFDETTRLDAGIGLVFRRIGLYVAVPLGGGDDGRVNLFVRLDRRF